MAQSRRLTISAGLDGRLDIPNTLHRNAILVVSVNILILKLANFVKQDTQLVCDIRDVFVAAFAPQGELLLQDS